MSYSSDNAKKLRFSQFNEAYLLVLKQIGGPPAIVCERVEKYRPLRPMTIRCIIAFEKLLGQTGLPN
jgi:hypothetical protein